MSAVCTIRGEFAGIPVGPCGRIGDVTLTGECVRGHRAQRIVCDLHASAFQVEPTTVFCEQCDSDGYESRMTITAATSPEASA